MVSLKDFVVNWADRAESALKKGCWLKPPGEIFDYLDLLERGWGRDRLAPCSGSNEWPAYKKYLKEYYRHNRAESISQEWLNEKDDGSAVNGNTDWNALTPCSSLQEDCADGDGIRDGGILVPLVSLCTKMETRFISECERHDKADQTADHIMLSQEIQRRALRLKHMEGEFPVAAALMGISMETKMICECLRQGRQVETLPWSKAIMENGWDILCLLYDECISSGNGNGTFATKAGNTAQMNYKKPDCDNSSKDIGNLVLGKIDIRELAENWANKAPAYLNINSMLLPPCGIFHHLDLLEKGWGWNRLVPDLVSNDWSSYKDYLKQYYSRNYTELVVQPCGNCAGVGTGLAPLVTMCVDMEKKFISVCQLRGVGGDASDHIILSREIQERALGLMNLKDEFPVAAAALMRP